MFTLNRPIFILEVGESIDLKYYYHLLIEDCMDEPLHNWKHVLLALVACLFQLSLYCNHLYYNNVTIGASSGLDLTGHDS